MEFKYISWIVLIIGVFINVFGLFWFVVFVFGFLSFLLGIITVLYLQHGDLDKFLDSGLLENPLEEPKTLGLNIVCDQKPSNLLLISPNIKIQTESKKSKSHLSDTNRKRNFLDAGIELLFKKHAKDKDGHVVKHKSNVITDHLMHKGHLHFQREDTILDNSVADHKRHNNHDHHHHQHHHGDEKKWKPFENIKIYTDKRKSHERESSMDRVKKKEEDHVQLGEECSTTSSSSPFSSFKSYIAHEGLHNKDQHGSPKKKKILSGNKQIDKLIHTIIDYIIRDFLDSWYSSVTDSKEFSDVNARNTIESSVLKFCQRIKNTQLLPLMTTKLIDDLSTHTRLYRLATQEVNAAQKSSNSNEQKRMRLHEKLSPQKRSLKGNGHRRNKSDTDLSWHLGNAAIQKNVSNSKFYGVQTDEQCLIDPETMLLNSFFTNCDRYKKECLDDKALEDYLTNISETVLYFTLPEEDFDCLALRTFLCTLLANIVVKPIINMVSDPDFINLQIARQFIKETPSGEFLIKMIRQSNDLSELRACRQLITREMDLKFKDSNCSAELASLKYTQKLIDLRISNLQNNKNDFGKIEKERSSSNLPILSLDDILTKELAVSYYLDYLSILNLQKYVIFYLTAQEWKLTTCQSFSEIQVNKSKLSKDEVMRSIRDKAFHLYQEYLIAKSSNYLNIDPGLIEALNIRIKDTAIQPENTWFDSICKYVYEKLKNEEVFLSNFYQSSAYKKLLFELDVMGQQNHESDISDMSMDHLSVHLNDGGSDSCSGEFFIETDDDDGVPASGIFENDIKEEHDIKSTQQIKKISYDLAVTPAINVKHARSHSDCTGMYQNINDINVEQLKSSDCSSNDSGNELAMSIPSIETHLYPRQNKEQLEYLPQFKQKLSAKIINTAIHCEGQYAVYAIQVSVIEDNHHKSWHIYRRYSKFLELKKMLVKRFSSLSKIQFPAKKAFQNTQRAVLEHRMEILNLFLVEICSKAENDDDMNSIIRNFLEPDTDDRKMHGGPVVKTIESLRSGMRTIRNMPDTLVGGISRIFLGKGPLKERTFYDISSLEMEQSEYPALASALNLLDEVFDLQNKSQWLRRGLINRLLGAPWVSHATNKKILHGAKTLLEMDKLETILLAVLNNVWPEGERQNPTQMPIREDSTKLRTKMAAKISLFALLSDDLKHVVGSVTCNTGLLNFFQMLQNKKLNTRLVLVLLDHVLNLVFQTDSMTKHVPGKSKSREGSRKSSKHN